MQPNANLPLPKYAYIVLLLAVLALAYAIGAGSKSHATGRMAECIEKLAEYENSLSYELTKQKGAVEYFYNPDRDLCLWRTNFGGYRNGAYTIEKRIADAATGEILAQYIEQDGTPATGTLSVFTATYREFYGEAQ